MKVLITAGATRNPIDSMRFISARASGRTGVGLAHALIRRGADVFLLGSPEARLRGEGLDGDTFGSTRDLMERMEQWCRAHPDGALVHSAAVGDYAVSEEGSGKVESGRSQWELTLVPTPKIADRVRPWGLRGMYVTFKAAAPGTSREELVTLAEGQRLRTDCDLVFANVLGRTQHDVALVGEKVRWFSTRDEALAALLAALTSS